MSRCGCRSGCGCTITDGPGINVNGSGSDDDPYTISTDDITVAFKTVSANYTLTDKDRIVFASGAITVKLPASPAAFKGRTFTLKRIGVGTVRFHGNGANIDNVAYVDITTQWNRVTVVSNGAKWMRID